MSDHEGDGLDLERWDDISIVSGSTFSYAPVPYVQGPLPPAGNDFHPPNGSRFPTDNGYGQSGQNGNHRPVGQHRAQPRRGARPQQSFLRPLTLKSAAQIRFEKGDPHSDQYELSEPWKVLRALSLRPERAAQPHPLQVLRNIATAYETWIRWPDELEKTLLIWGEPAKNTETKAALAQWELQVRESFSKDKPVSFVKVSALDGRAEHRVDRETQQSKMVKLLHDAEVEYPVEAAILWPKDLEDTEQFEIECAAPLDQLRSGFNCRITFPTSKPASVMVGALSETDIQAIMARLMNLIKETISRRQELVKENLIYLPEFDVYRDRVSLLDKDPKSESYLPTLHGREALSKEQLDRERHQCHISNRKKLKKAIDNAIKRLRMPQQHVRMRFVFGEIGFRLFRKPLDKSDTYTYDDFTTMVTKERNQLVLNGLPVRVGDITTLPDILDSMPAFHGCTEYYSGFFDFPGNSRNTVLRLETIFDSSGDRTESREKRWIELTGNVARLQISSLNFERPDYQATIDAFPLYSSKDVKGQQVAFQSNITMERPSSGIKSLPRRRLNYPRTGLGNLQNVSELIILRWQFKATDGVFELRRKDTYDARPGLDGGSPKRTDWHALYYYPEWDNLTGDFASVKPGEDVHWNKSVTTFFPETGEEWSPLPKGFKTFVNEIEEIQDLLATAIGHVARGKTTTDGFSVEGGETEDAYGPG